MVTSQRLAFKSRPILGGSLANPATKYPNVFGDAFFKKYPYFLPCFAGGFLALATAIIGIMFLKEVCSLLPSPAVVSHPFTDPPEQATSI